MLVGVFIQSIQTWDGLLIIRNIFLRWIFVFSRKIGSREFNQIQVLIIRKFDLLFLARQCLRFTSLNFIIYFLYLKCRLLGLQHLCLGNRCTSHHCHVHLIQRSHLRIRSKVTDVLDFQTRATQHSESGIFGIKIDSSDIGQI
jgi:hypothetical protein